MNYYTGQIFKAHVSYKAIGLYCYLANYASKYGLKGMSVDKLASRMTGKKSKNVPYCEGASGVNSGIDELDRAGFVTRRKNRNGTKTWFLKHLNLDKILPQRIKAWSKDKQERFKNNLRSVLDLVHKYNLLVYINSTNKEHLYWIALHLSLLDFKFAIFACHCYFCLMDARPETTRWQFVLGIIHKGTPRDDFYKWYWDLYLMVKEHKRNKVDLAMIPKIILPKRPAWIGKQYMKDMYNK